MAFKLEEVRTLEASAISADQRAFLEQNKSDLTTEELKKFDIKADDEGKKSVEGNEAIVNISASELEELRSHAKQGVEAAQKLATKEASDFASARIEAGQVKSDQKDDLTAILLASSGEGRQKLEKFLSGLPVNDKLSAGEQGDGGKETTTAAKDELHAKTVEKIQASSDAGKRLSYADARKAVLSADEGLATRIKDEEEK